MLSYFYRFSGLHYLVQGMAKTTASLQALPSALSGPSAVSPPNPFACHASYLASYRTIYL